MQKLAMRFGFTQNAQKPSDIKRSTADFADITSRIIVEDAVFAMASYRFGEIQSVLGQRLNSELGREMDHMISLISTMMHPREGAKSPSGDIGNLIPQSPIPAQDFGISWSDRTANYVNWKRKNKKSDKWWELTGGLAKTLSRRNFYTSNFGPIKITVTRKVARGRDAKGRFTSKPVDVKNGLVENIQSLGLRGRPSVYYTVATVAVEVFGKITAQMLPSLANGNPKSIASGVRQGSKVIDLIRNKTTRGKLGAAPDGEYRQLLDPFLSYYLTRTVPRRVSMMIENTLQRTGESQSARRLL